MLDLIIQCHLKGGLILQLISNPMKDLTKSYLLGYIKFLRRIIKLEIVCLHEFYPIRSFRLLFQEFSQQSKFLVALRYPSKSYLMLFQAFPLWGSHEYFLGIAFRYFILFIRFTLFIPGFHFHLNLFFDFFTSDIILEDLLMYIKISL